MDDLLTFINTGWMKNMEEENSFGNEGNSINEYGSSERELMESGSTKRQISKPLIAGILLIIAGILGIVNGITVSFVDTLSIEEALNQAMIQGQNISSQDIQNVLQICSIVFIVLSVFPILGGILAIKRNLWVGALICSIIGIFTIGPILISSILAIIATVLIATSKAEFIKKDEPSIKEYDDPF